MPAAPAVRLRRSRCSGPGLRRRRRGRGFSYVDDEGRRVTDPEVLGRIVALAVPPAWEDVWICPHPGGHIQATGVDARGPAAGRRHHRMAQGRDGAGRQRQGLPDLGRDGPRRDRPAAGAEPGTERARRRVRTRVVGEVAQELGNTPAVARASYIDPRVFERYEDGLTVSGALAALGEGDAQTAIQGEVEAAVLDLLTGGEPPPA